MLLESKDATKAYGGLLAVNHVSFSVQPGEILAVIGPNGAGKTTLLNLISGLTPLTSGEIRFDGSKLNGMGMAERVSLGIARTFQNMELFADMSVLENVMMGRYARTKAGFLAAGLVLPRAKAEEKETFQQAMQRLTAVGLAHRAASAPRDLPLGQQKLVALARALATDPALLLLDEPAGGLSSEEAEKLAKLVLDIRRSGVTILVVEHMMDFVLGLADRVIVMDFGQLIASGTPEQIRKDQVVIDAYLGE